jgi:hypothetical protein
LLNLFKTQLFADTDTTQNACIWNPIAKTAYQYVAFTSQDRSNFLFKYGGGFRYTQIYAPKTPGTSPYSGMLDVTMGQDETVTGGRMHGAVFKVDGQTPFPYGNLSFIYFFGSASIRLIGNQTSAPLVLATPQGGTPTIPNPAVAVLPLQQPNRDFYLLPFRRRHEPAGYLHQNQGRSIRRASTRHPGSRHHSHQLNRFGCRPIRFGQRSRLWQRKRQESAIATKKLSSEDKAPARRVPQ